MPKQVITLYAATVDPDWFAECPQRGPFEASGLLVGVDTVHDRVKLRFDDPNGTWVDRWFQRSDTWKVRKEVSFEYAQYSDAFPKCPDPRD